MLKKVSEIQAPKFESSNLYKLVGLRHENIVKLFLKRSAVFKRGMLKGRAKKIRAVQVITYKCGDCCHLQIV